MKWLSFRLVLALGTLWSAPHVLGADGAQWRAGVSRDDITPKTPLWLAGYGSRTNSATGTSISLWLKVLALEDARGHRAIIVTSDLLGIPQTIYQHTCATLKEKFGLAPEQILLSASHTHCGPVLRGALYDVYPLDDKQISLIESYSAELETKLIATVASALADLAPVRLAAAQGVTRFAVNRRNNREAGVPKLIEEGALKGPVDHSVPVLAVYRPNGDLKAILFGYACHNTVMDFYEWSGDYAGWAQRYLEKDSHHPGVTAMFFMGCGGDQNPLPRRDTDLSMRYGRMLASAVEEALLSPPRTLAPELETRMEMVPLKLGAAPTEAELEKAASDKSPVTRRWAARLLAQSKSGKPFMREYPFPLQAWRFGHEQLLVTLGGEPVVDYALKFKAQFGPQTWVAGYCNDVMNYIPSLRVLREDMPDSIKPGWGYEGARATIVYGLPAFRWAEDIEDQITLAAEQLVKGFR
jgi:hypothetical protein